MDTRQTQLKFTLEEIVQLLDVSHKISEDMRLRLAEWLRTDPRLANPFKQLEKMAKDARTDDLGDALDQHQRFERWLATADLPGDIMAPEEYAQLLSIAAARLERARAEERPNLRRVQSNLGRSYLKGLTVSLYGRDVTPQEFTAQLDTFPPEVVADFLRPFRSLLDQEEGARDA